MRISLIAFLWGFAEATLFFLVPDVFLSGVSIHDFKKGVFCCFIALLGALAGGALMYAWGESDVQTVLSVLDYVPAISVEMLERVRTQISTNGPVAMFFGPISGTPYKIYAVQAGALQTSFFYFASMSIPARAIRFILVTALFGWIGKSPAAKLTRRQKTGLHLGLWIVFYSFFFSLMPN